MVLANRISDGFFATMGIPVSPLGRDFSAGDGARPNADAAMINEALAARAFPGRKNPIGRRFRLSGPDPLEIVGVVANSKYYSLRKPSKQRFTFMPRPVPSRAP